MGKYQRAIQDYDEAIRLDPQDAFVYINRGIAYHDLGQYQRAIQDFDEAIRLDPESDLAYLSRGIAYYDLGQFERAIDDYDEHYRLEAQDERETIQTVIQSMMVKYNLASVTASDDTANPKGKQLPNTGTDFHTTYNIEDFMDQSTTKYCYKWDAFGRITYQYDVDDTNGDCNTELYAAPGAITQRLTLPPAGSSAKNLIAFASKIDVGQAIYLMGGNGENVDQLTNHLGWSVKGLLWSPDGSKLAIEAIPDGESRMMIYILETNGPVINELTELLSVVGDNPSWPPNSTNIAFGSNFVVNGELNLGQFVINVDGDGLRELARSVFSVFSLSGPTWAPNGSQLVYSAKGQIHVVNEDGSQDTMLTDESIFAERPKWSPDGNEIAFLSSSAAGPGWGDIHVMNSDGSNIVNITNNPGAYSSFRWSPDSNQIAFQYVIGTGGNLEILIINRDGSGLTNISDYPGVDVGPSWSADGRHIVFHSNHGFPSDIYSYSLDDSELTNLTSSPEGEYFPAWSP